MRKVEIAVKVPQLLLSAGTKSKRFYRRYLDASFEHIMYNPFTRTTGYFAAGLAAFCGLSFGYSNGKESANDGSSERERRKLVYKGMIKGCVTGAVISIFWPLFPAVVPFVAINKALVYASKS